MEWIITGAIVALLTLLDLDQKFHIPSNTQKKILLYSWWWGFILANAILSSLFYCAVADFDALNLKNIQPAFRAIIVGLGYLALLRAKLTTFKVQDKEIPLGIELVYEGTKSFVYKRINRIAKIARIQETREYIQNHSLTELEQEAKLGIDQDALLTNKEKKDLRDWIDKVIKDLNSSDQDKRITLATFILSGQRIE